MSMKNYLQQTNKAPISHSMNGRQVEGLHTEPSFSQVFAPLANHFFPDGCPLLIGSYSSSSGGDQHDSSGNDDDTREAKYLQEVCP